VVSAMSGHVGLREERRAGRFLARRIARLFMPGPVKRIAVKPAAELPAFRDAG
jgi:hypothetical protein